MIDLTSEMTIEIHDTVIERYSGLFGILCLGTVDYLAAKINDEPAHPQVPARSRGCEARLWPQPSRPIRHHWLIESNMFSAIVE